MVNGASVTQSVIGVSVIDDWNQWVRPETAQALEANKFTTLQGNDPIPYRALNLSAISRATLVADIRNPFAFHETFKNIVVPALEKIYDNFKILGHVVLPSTLKLIPTDLNVNICVFTFPVIQDEPNLIQKLTEIGLERTLTHSEWSTHTLEDLK